MLLFYTRRLLPPLPLAAFVPTSLPEEGLRKCLPYTEQHRHNICVGAFLLSIPKDDFFLFEGGFHIDDALVGGTAETKRDVLERLHKRTIHKDIYH